LTAKTGSVICQISETVQDRREITVIDAYEVAYVLSIGTKFK